MTFHKRENRFTIEDPFEGTGKHRIDIHWQSYPGLKTATGECSFSLQGPKASLMATVTSTPALTISEVQGQKKPLGGWYFMVSPELLPFLGNFALLEAGCREVWVTKSSTVIGIEKSDPRPDLEMSQQNYGHELCGTSPTADAGDRNQQVMSGRIC